MTDATLDPVEWAYDGRKQETLTYAQTSTSPETVLGLVCSKSATKTVKIFVTLTQPYGVFIENFNKPPIDANGDADSTKAANTKDCIVSPFVGGQMYKLTLLNGQTVKAGTVVMAQGGTGKIKVWDGTEAPIGHAVLGATASGADGTVYVIAWPNQSPILVSQETVTISSNYGYITNAPAFEIVEAEITTGTWTGPANWMRTGTPNRNGEIKINMTTGQIDTYASDAATALKIDYKIIPKTY